MTDCGLVDFSAINNVNIEPIGCLGPNENGFDVKQCKGCEFYPQEKPQEQTKRSGGGCVND